MSKADDIAAALLVRLQQITRDNGYATNAGLNVFEGRAAVDPERLPCVVIFEPEDVVQSTTRGPDGTLPAGVIAHNQQPYEFEAFAECDPDHPNRTARALIADIKRAVFRADLTLGGLVTRIVYTGRRIDTRTHGSTIVSAVVMIEAVFNEDLANP